MDLDRKVTAQRLLMSFWRIWHVDANPDPRKYLESRSPNLGPYTTKGTLYYFLDPPGGLGRVKFRVLLGWSLYGSEWNS